MNNEVLVAMARYTPVESPLEHRESLVARQRRKGFGAIEPEHDLPLDPTAKASRALNAHVEVSEAGLGVNGVLRVVQFYTAPHGTKRRANAGDDRPCLQAQPALPQEAFKSRLREVRNDQDRSVRTKPRASSSVSTANRLWVSAAASANVAISEAVALLGGPTSASTSSAISSR